MIRRPSRLRKVYESAENDAEAFYHDMSATGVLFSMPPKKQDFGGVLARFVDSEGANCSIGVEAA